VFNGLTVYRLFPPAQSRPGNTPNSGCPIDGLCSRWPTGTFPDRHCHHLPEQDIITLQVNLFAPGSPLVLQVSTAIGPHDIHVHPGSQQIRRRVNSKAPLSET